MWRLFEASFYNFLSKPETFIRGQLLLEGGFYSRKYGSNVHIDNPLEGNKDVTNEASSIRNNVNSSPLLFNDIAPGYT